MLIEDIGSGIICINKGGFGMYIKKEIKRYHVGVDEYDAVRKRLQKLHQEYTFAEIARHDPFWIGRLNKLNRGRGGASKTMLEEIDAYLDIFLMLQ